MNQRIKELAEKAGFMDAWYSESGDDCEHEIKKFAQLIINECAGIYEAIDNGNKPEGTDNYLKALAKRFGVEE